MQDSSEDRLHRAMAAVRDEDMLRSRLEEIVRRKGLQTASVGVAVGGHELTLSTGAAAHAEANGPAAGNAQVAAGCLAKPLTAALLHDEVAAGRLSWDDEIAGVLTDRPLAMQRLAGIRLRHLPDHTHGLDAAELKAVPRCADGFIDVGALCAGLSAQPLFAPGRMYSYSHVGAWLAGAVLERVRGARYAALVRDRWPFAPVTHEVDFACPATGVGLAPTVTQWLAFARDALPRLRPGADGAHEDMALPGWHPSERAIVRGWKSYGQGWLGHNANLADCSALLRVQPSEQLAIVVSASGTNGAVFAASGVFGDLLPEFRNLRPPRLLRADEAAALPLHHHLGRYVQARSVIEVERDAQGALQMRVGARQDGINAQDAPASRLRAADGGLFLSESRGHPEFQFVQFIAEDPKSDCSHLWNGRQVWRKEAASQ